MWGRTADAGSLCDHLIDHSAVLGRQGLDLGHIHLVGDHQQGLVGEQGLDGVEQGGLLRQGVAALLADVQHVQHRRSQMRQRRCALRHTTMVLSVP